MRTSSGIAGVLSLAVIASLAATLPGGSAQAQRLGAPGVQTASATKATLPVLPTELGRGRNDSSTHRLLVKLERSVATSRTSVAARMQHPLRQVAPLGGRWYAMRDVATTDAAISRLRQTPGVATVQRERIRHAFGDELYRRYQPYLRGSMDVNTAWRRSSGRGVTVAVLDTGVDARHEDLPRVRRGRDFVSGDRRPQDPVGHGTFVAGVIAAERDNRRGIAGVSRATILPARVLNARGAGRDGTIAQAMRWAVRERADIINLSLGGARSTRVLKDAVRHATRNGVLVVASAGNSGGTRPMYPAGYSDALAVGATDFRDRMTWWSQHGSWLDITAPGARIVSTVPGDGYAIGSGTSFSAPLVAGAAALVWAKHPGWSVDQLRAALLRGAADAGPIGPDAWTGVGVPDVDGMLGASAKRAVGLTGPLTGTAPGNARQLQRDSAVTGSNPEGTDRWFELNVNTATRITVSAALRKDRAGSLRGDVELTLYDSDHGRLDRSNTQRGRGTERVQAVVDDTVYVRVHNLHDTRWPDVVRLGFSREAAAPGKVQTGGAPRPVLITATPRPESYGAQVSDPISVITGMSLRPGSIDRQSVRLIDGASGAAVSINVSSGAGTVTVTPDAPLATDRSYTLVLDRLRTQSGGLVPTTRLGFRTAT